MGRHRSNVSARLSARDTFPAETRFSNTTTELKQGVYGCPSEPRQPSTPSWAEMDLWWEVYRAP